MPCHFVVNSDGKLVGTINNGTLASGFDVVPPAVMVRGLKELLTKAGGPGLTDKQYAEFQKLLTLGRDLVSNNRMSEAAKTLKPLSDYGKNIALVVDAKELLVRVDREASTAFAKANSRLAENPLAGVAALDKVAADYPGTESAASARKAAAEFRSSPAGKKAVKEMAREQAGRKEMEKGLAAAGKDDAKALRTLDGIARKYSGLPVGDDAKAKAEAIRSDPERMKAIKAAEDERAAKSALFLARGLKDGGRTEEARKKLQEIVDKYPDTKYAKEAAKLLEELR
jgi:hypothetical protein